MKMGTLIASAALAVSAATALPVAAQVVNNGGFENPPTVPVTPNDWQYNGAGAGRDGTLVHGGLFSANLDNVSEANNANAQQQTAFGSVTAGTQYTLGFWAQSSYGVSGIGQAQVAFMDGGGGILAGFPQFINIPTFANYTQMTQNFTAPPNSSALFLAFNAVTGAVSGATSHLRVDDVTFTVVPEPTGIAFLGLSVLAASRRRCRR